MGKLLDANEVEVEFKKIIDSKNLNWQFIRCEHELYINKSNNKKGRNWKIFFTCEKGHKDNKSLSNLRKVKICRKCRGEGLSLEERIVTLQNKHNNFYDYSEFKKQGYKNSKSKIPIICPFHGLFYQEYTGHKSGNGCQKCAGVASKTGKEILDLVNISSNGFVSAINIKKDTIYKSDEKYEIKCNVHAWHPIEKRNLNKISREGISCSYCRASKYSLIAYQTLHQLGIDFEIEFPVIYKDRSVSFIDIVLKDKKNKLTFIEIDGEQHSLGLNWGTNKKNQKKNFSNIRKLDRKKNKYAKLKNINLIRINYNEDIKKIIYKTINDGNFKQKRIAKKITPFNLIRDTERRAYEVHIMYQKGIKPREIKIKMNMLGSHVSKILHGERFKELFLYLYPDGINKFYKHRRFKHLKLSANEHKYLTELIFKDLSYNKIKIAFEKKFKSISAQSISRIAKLLGYKSKYWIYLNKINEDKMLNLRKEGKSYKEISRIFSEEIGIKMSKPWVINKIKDLQRDKN